MSVASLANQLLVVERADVLIVDKSAGIMRDFSELMRIRGRAQPLSGTDVKRFSRPDMTVTHKVYVPGDPDIRQGDRLRVAGLILYVQAPRNVDLANKFTTLECEQRAE